MPPRIFTPDPDFVERSYLTQYRRQVNQKYRQSLETYGDLHKWSVTEPNHFWMSLWDFLPVKASKQPKYAVDESKRIDERPEFYPRSRLNYTENILSMTGSGTAVHCLNEHNLDDPEVLTWDELREKVRVYTNALKVSGYNKGDVMCVIGGSNSASLALVLAAGAIGGIVACFATDAGERVLMERIGQINPKLLFAQHIYSYNGKQHDITSRIESVWQLIKNRAKTELIATESHSPSSWTSHRDFLDRTSDSPLEFSQLPFHTPFVILFSSGSTGEPKAIVHSQGGLVINGMKEHILHYNHDNTTTHYHYAGIGWTLWNIMIGALFTGATITLYDGSPFYPSPLSLLKSVLSTGVTSFGAGPRYFTELQRTNTIAKPYTSLIDKIPSAGALLTEQMSLWISQTWNLSPNQICQISTSGGTELCGNFVHGTQTLPSYAGENACLNLGMDVAVYSPQGELLPPGEPGELVCRKAFPNMPVFFWNDPQGKNYHAAYFKRFPHVWCHGDFIRINPETGGSTILGRSDGVLNPSGIRFGSGEIYTVLERVADKEVADAICVGQQRGQDQTERVFLFLVLRTKGRLSAELEKRIRDGIANELSRRHVPQFMFAVDQIPYNVNGKKLEIPLRAVLSEGKQAFSRRKFTAEELSSLEQYLPFFKVEKVVQRELKAKL